MSITNFSLIPKESLTCNDLVQDCYDACYNSRLDLTNSLTERLEIVLPILIVLILARLFLHKFVKNDDLLSKIYLRIDFSMFIIVLFLICILYIF